VITLNTCLFLIRDETLCNGPAPDRDIGFQRQQLGAHALLYEVPGGCQTVDAQLHLRVVCPLSVVELQR